MKLMKMITGFCMLILLVGFASALGVSPGSVSFENLARGGYAEEEIYISSFLQDDLALSYTVIDGDWIEIELEDDTVKANEFMKAKIKVNIPENAGNGEYRSKIIFYGTPLAIVQEGKSSKITSGITIDVYMGVIGEEILSCSIGGVNVVDIERTFPLEMGVGIKNNGNVQIRPAITVKILDREKTNELFEYEFLAKNILPTTTAQTFESIENELEIGQYWVEINVPLCGFSETKTFDVVERGSIVDEGELVKIKLQNSTVQGSIASIQAFFKNTGPRIVSAKFQGGIVKDGKIVELIETDFVDVIPGDIEILEAYYEPEETGIYQVSGRVVYNNKVSFEKEAFLEVTGAVVDGDGIGFKFDFQKTLIMIVVLAIITLLIMIIKKKHFLKK